MASAAQGKPSRPAADMRPCRRCGRTDPRRMVGLMTLWFGPAAGFQAEPGYFYLCPTCYQACIAPLANVIVHRLTEHHPLAKKLGQRPITPSEGKSDSADGDTSFSY